MNSNDGEKLLTILNDFLKEVDAPLRFRYNRESSGVHYFAPINRNGRDMGEVPFFAADYRFFRPLEKYEVVTTWDKRELGAAFSEPVKYEVSEAFEKYLRDVGIKK